MGRELDGSLSVGLLSSQRAEVYGPSLRQGRASGCRSLNNNLNQATGVDFPLGFHYLKPALRCFFDVVNSLLHRLALGKASGKGWNLGNIISGFILFYQYMELHEIITPPFLYGIQ